MCKISNDYIRKTWLLVQMLSEGIDLKCYTTDETSDS